MIEHSAAADPLYRWGNKIQRSSHLPRPPNISDQAQTRQTCDWPGSMLVTTARVEGLTVTTPNWPRPALRAETCREHSGQWEAKASRRGWPMHEAHGHKSWTSRSHLGIVFFKNWNRIRSDCWGEKYISNTILCPDMKLASKFIRKTGFILCCMAKAWLGEVSQGTFSSPSPPLFHQLHSFFPPRQQEENSLPSLHSMDDFHDCPLGAGTS